MQTCVWVGVFMRGFVGQIVCVFIFKNKKLFKKKDFVMYIKKAKCFVLTISVRKKNIATTTYHVFNGFLGTKVPKLWCNISRDRIFQAL